MALTRDQKLNQLLDKQEIEEVIARFARGCDRRDADLMVSTFHTDGVFVRPHIDEPPKPVGSAGWGANAVRTLDGLSKSSTHYILQTLIDLDGDTAYAESYALTCVVEDKDGEEKALFRAVRLFHRLERRDGETWKIAYRTTRVEGFFVQSPLANIKVPDRARSKASRDDIVYNMKELLQFKGMEADHAADA